MNALPNSLKATGRGLPPILNRAEGQTPPAAGGPGGGKATGEIVRQSNRWRDQYNPLRNLVISRVVTIMEAAERGDFAELQLVMRKIEKRYPVLKALKSRRLAALEKLDWDIKVMDPLPEGVTEAQAEQQRTFLRSRYDLIENLTDAFGFLVTAEFRGYAILQKHRVCSGESMTAAKHDGAVCEFHWLPQDQFARDGAFGDWYYNKDSRMGIGLDSVRAQLGEANRIGSEQLPREEFLIREVESPLYEVALIAFVNWAMGRKDWSAFVEIFGLPNAIVILPPGIPQGKEDEYRSAAEKVADGVSGALPNGSDAKFPTSSVRGSAPFKEFCEAHDQDVVLAGTGGLLTMLSMPTGIGQGASGEHGDAFDDIAEADARKINSVLQTQFDKLELAQEFPNQPVAVYFELCSRDEQDVTETINQIATLKGAGYAVAREVVAEKTGFELAEASAQEDGRLKMEDGKEQITNRDSAPSPQATLAETLAPLLERLDAINQVRDDATRTALLKQFAATEIEEIRAALKLNPALARVLTPVLEKEMKL